MRTKHKDESIYGALTRYWILWCLGHGLSRLESCSSDVVCLRQFVRLASGDWRAGAVRAPGLESFSFRSTLTPVMNSVFSRIKLMLY